MNSIEVSIKKICFISHNATRTGAPIVLYNLVKWIKENKQDEVEVWFLEAGEMLDDFKAICSCRVLQQKNTSRFTGLFKKISQKILGADFSLRRQLKGLYKFEVVCFNTIASLKAVPLLAKEKQTSWIAYLHEQPFSINKYYADYCTAEILNRIDQFIVVSGKTATFLTHDFFIAKEKIKLLPPFIDVGKLLAQVELHKEIKHKDEFVIGACGLQDWRKGPDLFLQLAFYFKKKYPKVNVNFRWVGAPSGMTKELKYELQQMDLQANVEFTGATSEVFKMFNNFDLFVLTSREDPFPLVVMEACALQKPVICFSGVGDITNLVGVIPKNVVPYTDVEVMAERILFYYENRTDILKDGQLLSGKIADFDISKAAPLVYNEFQDKSKAH